MTGHVLPPHAERFPLPKPQREADQRPRSYTVVFGHPDQFPGLGNQQRGEFMLRGLRSIDQIRRVDGDQLPLDRHVQGVGAARRRWPGSRAGLCRGAARPAHAGPHSSSADIDQPDSPVRVRLVLDAAMSSATSA